MPAGNGVNCPKCQKNYQENVQVMIYHVCVIDVQEIYHNVYV